MSLADKLKENKLVQYFYKFMFFSGLGMRPIEPFTRHIGEFTLISVGLNSIFGINVKEYWIIVIVSYVSLIILLALSGYTYRRLGLQHVEDYVNNMHNPVSDESLTKIREIHEVIKNEK